MTMNVLVGSVALATVVEVEGVGLTPIEAQRHAVTIARGLHRISDPVAIGDDHKSAKVYRAIADQKRQELIASIRASLARNAVPLSRQRQSVWFRG